MYVLQYYHNGALRAQAGLTRGQAEPRTCDGLEEVSVVLQVVVAIIVIGSLAEHSALLVRQEVLLQRRL